jgi:hypothetical protein
MFPVDASLKYSHTGMSVGRSGAKIISVNVLASKRGSTAAAWTARAIKRGQSDRYPP